MNRAQGSEAPWFKLLAVTLAMIAAGIGAMIATTDQAEAAANDLTIISLAGGSGAVGQPSSRGLYICENWTASTSTASTCTSGIDGYLLPGQNSRIKYGVPDFDGIRVDAGYSLKKSTDSIRGDGDDVTIAGCRASTFWRKVSPSIADPGENEDYFYLWNCPAY